MTDKKSPETPESEGSQKPPRESEERRVLKRLVYGSLLAGGALSLADWNAQAHGNRSSHDAAQVLWAPSDYVVNRQAYLEPDAPVTREITSLVAELDALQRKEMFARTGRPAIPKTLRQQIQLKRSELQSKRNELERQHMLTPTTSRVMNFLRARDMDGAVAVIEGQKEPMRVIAGYIWAQMDLYNLGMMGHRSTPVYTQEIIALSRAGIRYYEALENKPPELQRAAVSLYHNLASFALPDLGKSSAEARAIAREAASKELEISKSLGDPGVILRAHWMVGLTALETGELEQAAENFRIAAEMAERQEDRSERAWALAYLGLTNNRQGTRAEARRLFAQARDIFTELDDQYALVHLKEVTAGI